MSLIHQALRDMDPPAATGAAALAPRVSAAPRRNARARRPVLLAVVAALALAGGAGYAAWHSLRSGPQPMVVGGMPAAVAATPAPMMATAAAATLPSAAGAAVPGVEAPPASGTAVPAVVVAADPLATTAPVAAGPVPASAPAARVVVADAAVVPRTDPVARPPALRPRAAAPAPVVPARAPASVPAVRPVAPPVAIPVEQRFGLFLQAMRGKDLPTAEQHLAALRRDLPRSSVSLLRAEGWYALAQGDTDGAARHYQDILERQPGDEEASINLAGIESRRQRTEVARQILADGVRAHPESESLKSALAGFRATP